MSRPRPRWAELRGLRLVLLLLALSVKLLTPPGYMPGVAAGSPFVICTGAGATIVSRLDRSAPTDPAGHKSSSICAFAEHGAWPAPAPVLIPGAAQVAYLRADQSPAADLAPGRGLIAPPPPSRGPPRLL